MAINVKAFDELEELTELSGDEKVLVNDGGVAKRMPADMVKGVASWNDLPDKPFGEKKIVEKILVDEMTFEHETEGYSTTISLKLRDHITVGETYIITFDGVKYECVCCDPQADVAIGNLSLMFSSEEDTKEPFFMKEDMYNHSNTFVYCTELGTHTFTIGKLEETIPPVPTEMLPEPLRFGETVVSEEVLGETSFEITDNSTPSHIVNPFSLTLVEGWKYIVTWNGITYVTNCTNQGGCWIGNGSLVGMPEDNGMPFFIGNMGSDTAVYGEPGIHTISVMCEGVKVERLARKYAPAYFDIFVNNEMSEFDGDTSPVLDINYDLSSGKTITEIIEGIRNTPSRLCLSTVYGTSTSENIWYIVNWTAGYDHGNLCNFNISFVRDYGYIGCAEIAIN